MKRSKLTNAAFCAMLALAGTLLCLGMGLVLSAANGLRYVDEHFTTIAVLDIQMIRNRALNQIGTRNIDEYVMGQQTVFRHDLTLGAHFNNVVANYIQSETIAAIDSTVYRSGAVEMDTRRIFGAHSPGILPFYHINPWIPGNAGEAIALVGSVVSIEEIPQIGFFEHPETGEHRINTRALGLVTMDIEEVVSIHRDILPFDNRQATNDRFLRRMHMLLPVQDAGGGYFFTVGGRYFVSGEYEFSRVLRHPNTVNSLQTHYRSTIGFYDWFNAQDTTQYRVEILESYDTADLMRLRMNEYFDIWMTPDDLPIEVWATRIKDENVLPKGIFALGDMTMEEALASDIGDGLREAIHAAEMGANQLNVITTSNLYSLLPFNQRYAYIIEGREFAREEYESGARVALIPRLLAEGNQLSVGDTLTLTFFEGELRQFVWAVINRYNNMRRMWMTGGFSPGMRESEFMVFEIIGIYESPRPAIYEYDAHIIPRNTLIILDNAIAVLPRDGTDPMALRAQAPALVTPEQIMRLHDLPTPLAPMLNVITIPNGENETFREMVIDLMPEYAGLFHIYDQGYSVVRPAMENLLSNTSVIFALCLAGWLLAVIVFCLFYVLRMKKEAGLLYALGIRKRDRYRWVYMQCAVVVLAAFIFAFAASALLYEHILGFAVDASFARIPEATAFSDGNITAEGTQREIDVLRNPLAIPFGVGAGVAVTLLFVGVVVRGLVKSDPQSLKGVDG
jgi:hypothetical protein